MGPRAARGAMRAPRVEAFRARELPPDVAEEATRAAPSPLQAPALLRAFEAAGADAFLLRVADEGRALAHALVLETRLHGFGTWTGLGGPVLRAGADVEAAWRALVAAARAAKVVSASWRDLTMTRLADADLAAARAACEAQGGVVTAWPFQARVLDLAPSPDALWEGMHRKHRNAARLAEGSGVRAGPAGRAGFAEAYAPLADATWARSGQSGPPAAYYARLVEDPGFVPYLARDADGTPVAGAVVAAGGGRAVYLHGASSHAAPGASTLLQWAILRDLRGRGVAAYDLGGDPPPGAPDDTPRMAGIRRFKERFGGEAQAWTRLHLQVDPPGYAQARAAMAAARPGA